MCPEQGVNLHNCAAAEVFRYPRILNLISDQNASTKQQTPTVRRGLAE
jgi:hypothetical protein